MKKLLSLTLAIAIIICAIPLGTFTFTARAEIEYTEGYYDYTVSKGKATITDVYQYISGDVTIPSTLGGYTVTSIGYEAFWGCTGLTSITIPDSVTSIGNYAFNGCTGLTSVTIGDSVTSIGGAAFDGCTGLTSVTIGDSVTSIGSSAFNNCYRLTSITIPDSVTRIGDGAFKGCNNIESITLPFVGSSRSASGTYDAVFGYIFGYTSSSSAGGTTRQYYASGSYYYYYIPSTLKTVTITDATQIPYGAFYNCTGLTSVTIPDSVTSIGYRAFYGCTGLTSVTIPDSVTSIGDWAFEGCTGLTSVTIGDRVTSIGERAFKDCKNLTEVYYTGTKQDRENIKIGDENWELYNATWYYNYGKTYPDVSQNAWYTDAVTYAVGAGLITGYGGTNLFGTADQIQRQDFVVILARLAGVDLNNYVSSGRYSFADVPKGAYYEKAIMWAADAGITTGYAGGTKFGVGDKITREQLVTFLYRYAKYANGGVAPAVSADAADKAAAYADFTAVTDYAQEAIIWALDIEVIKGQGGTHIAPGGNALRCEVAQIIYNIYLNDIF